MQAQQARETSEQVDPAGFIQSLPPALRQQVLADMDDSMVAVLPNDLASEANMLRRQLEDRQRRLMQERLFAQGSGPLSAILRHSGEANRVRTGLGQVFYCHSCLGKVLHTCLEFLGNVC